MRIPVYGCGVIGSLLVHALCTAGNEVTVISRGRWKEILSTDGLHLKYVLQHKETIDHPEVAEQVTGNVSWDLVFSVTQGWQQEALLDTLPGIHGEMLVLIGNNPLCQEMEKKIHGLTPEQKVLFGFQSSAGVREEHAVKIFRAGKTGLTLGYVHQKPEEPERKMLGQALDGSGFCLEWCDDMQGYLYTHAAFVLPCVYLCYGHGCDLRIVRYAEIRCVLQAARERYRLRMRSTIRAGYGRS